MFNHLWGENVNSNLHFHPANPRTYSNNWLKTNLTICQKYLSNDFYLKPETIQKLSQGNNAEIIQKVLNALIKAYQNHTH